MDRSEKERPGGPGFGERGKAPRTVNRPSTTEDSPPSHTNPLRIRSTLVETRNLAPSSSVGFQFRRTSASSQMDRVSQRSTGANSQESTYVLEALSSLSASELSDKAKDLNARLERLDREEAVQVARARALGMVDQDKTSQATTAKPEKPTPEKKSPEG